MSSFRREFQGGEGPGNLNIKSSADLKKEMPYEYRPYRKTAWDRQKETAKATTKGRFDVADQIRDNGVHYQNEMNDKHRSNPAYVAEVNRRAEIDQARMMEVKVARYVRAVAFDKKNKIHSVRIPEEFKSRLCGL